jgi:hypothetical protein
MLAMRWVALGVALAGCLHGKSHPCTGDDGVSWVCPDDKACAAAPVYCGTADEVGACDGKMERDPCATLLVPDGQCISDQCTACSFEISGCRYVGWNPMMSPATTTLAAVAFTDVGQAYAAGDGTVLRYQIAGWTVDDRFPAAALAGAKVTQLVATGSKVYAYLNTNVVYVLAGDAWTALPAQPTKSYKAMWATGSDVFLVGAVGQVAHYDGATWDEPMAGATTFNAVWGTSASDVYAVGGQSTAASVVEHYDGTTWTPVASTGMGLFAVWGAGGEVFAAGSSIIHSTGGAFTTMPSPAITAHGLWGSSATDVDVVGDGGTILHWDGVTWVKVTNASSVALGGVAGSSAAEVFAVGAGGTILRYTGAVWADTSALQPAATHLLDVFAAAPNEAFAVGNQNADILHFRDGTGWATDPSTLSAPLDAVWGRGSNDVLVVGLIESAHYTGSWTASGAPPTTSPNALWGDATKTYAVGARIDAFDGTAWTNISMQDNQLEGVWVSPSDRIWLVGNLGISHLETTTVVSDVTTSFQSVWGAADDDVFAVGTHGIQHFDGQSWAAMTVPSAAPLTKVWGRATDDVFAVGGGNTVLHYHAGLCKQFTTTFAGDLASVSGAGSSIYIASTDGHVYRLIETAP